MLQAHHPDLVHGDRIDTAKDGASGRWGDWTSGVNLAHDTDEFTANGVVGDPSEGDAELGHELTQLATKGLTELLDAVSERPLD
jgi:creatinine amidohydrolase